MQPELDSSSDHNEPAYLRVTTADGKTSTMVLEPNTSLFAGAGSNCRVVLAGDDVYPIHCMFWLDEEMVLRIQDWNTGGRTVLNGTSISDETVLNSGDKIEIGSNLIESLISSKSNQPDEDQSTSDQAKPIQSQIEPTPPMDAHSIISPSTENEELEVASTEEIPTQVKADSPVTCPQTGANVLAAGTEELEYEFEYEENDMDPDNDLESTNNYDFDSNPLDASDTSAEDESEYLQMEIEQLRCDIADRDAQIQMLRDSEGTTSDVEEDDQTLQLVKRLEELLCELQNSDERVNELEELLRVSDQAIQAEQEERQQLESWVTEIETRVGQREAEADAELNRVLNSLKEVKAKHKQAEAHLRKALQTNAQVTGDGSNEALNGLSLQVNELHQRLESAEAENEELKSRSHDDNNAREAQEQLQQVEQKMMKLEVETSRERAELARQRVQLERLKDEFEQKLNSTRRIGDADTRIQAMRQHLQEIHEQEKLEREEKKQHSLSGRISRLLSRVGN